LGINLIAEGIETKEQLELLKELGCDFGQGYLFSKAIEFKAATDFIKKSI
jgi:EAL domain-containing protein (putative c-di-GMP-specific phosphodiesterase class I)